MYVCVYVYVFMYVCILRAHFRKVPQERGRVIGSVPVSMTGDPLETLPDVDVQACALMWRQFCDAEGEGVYDPEEHGAPFLRRPQSTG